MEKLRVLLAEDDKNLGVILKNYLEAKNYVTHLYANGESALHAYQHHQYDLCILDVMMPVMDGFTLAEQIRKSDKKIPILFLTAKSLQDDILQGFKSGGDDYITKPFNMEELLARMTAILRRSRQNLETGPKSNIFRIGKFTFDYNRQQLTINSQEHKLTSKEADLLRMLCENVNQVLDRKAALVKIWNDDSYFNARSMDVYIVKLRKVLKEDPDVELINVHGVGFKLVTRE
ncbi:MAG TPA: response regulator transcription factor [Bacteroidales bacterium]|nr:response regulator transcription factor [Bacteroidales bacterium]HSA44545.1 response regulator transcription factor [Bacteroidales bacterium]